MAIKIPAWTPECCRDPADPGKPLKIKYDTLEMYVIEKQQLSTGLMLAGCPKVCYTWKLVSGEGAFWRADPHEGIYYAPAPRAFWPFWRPPATIHLYCCSLLMDEITIKILPPAYIIAKVEYYESVIFGGEPSIKCQLRRWHYKQDGSVLDPRGGLYGPGYGKTREKALAMALDVISAIRLGVTTAAELLAEERYLKL